jgi:hypothetical protein
VSIVGLPVNSGTRAARVSNGFKLSKSIPVVQNDTLDFTGWIRCAQSNKSSCAIAFRRSAQPNQDIVVVYPNDQGGFTMYNGPSKQFPQGYEKDRWYKIRLVV